jgi:hypothetical protein
MLVLWPVCGNAAGNGSLGDAVKATFVSKFADFVEWPMGSAQDRPFVLCAVGDDAVSALMDRAAAGQRVGESSHRGTPPAAGLSGRWLQCRVSCRVLHAIG